MLKKATENKSIKAKTDKAPAKAPAPAAPMIFGFNEPEFFTLPFSMMRRMAEDMETLMSVPGLFRDPIAMFDPRSMPANIDREIAAWTPKVEILHRDKKFIVKADLPGIKKDDIKVEIVDNWLIIEGERADETVEKEGGFYHSERTFGSFFRRIPLPEGAKHENAAASFHDGVLEIAIEVPHVKPAPKRIEINADKPKAHAARSGK